MDENIKQSIRSRKDAFSMSFQVSEKMQKKIDALFLEIEKLGAKCKDVQEFEAEFSKSPLNQQYMDLFTEIATESAGKQAAGQVAKSMATGAVEGIVRNALGGVVPTRASVHQKAYDEVRKVPGLGNAIDISEKASYAMHLGKLFGKKKKEE
ncbi:hypothetical protein IJU85_02170 [Candidatus Saccharibacteria bacterium]|nr:hypothetical protein [Candidatus Saccharibacteria bacterium]